MSPAEMFAAHALAGLCANPHHRQDEHPNMDSLAVVDRAFALGNALAAKFASAEPGTVMTPGVLGAPTPVAKKR